MALNLLPISAFDDNYIWMIHDGHAALVVDPGDAAPVIAALERQALTLAAILVTHHHGDHVGGLRALREHSARSTGQAVPIWATATEAMPVETTPVRGGDSVEALGLHWQVIDVPGHTAGHIAFYAATQAGTTGSLDEPVLFCGDTLFSGGCGRLFEGTPAQMLASLRTLAALPDATRVCCAHEYTLSNLRFARAVEPANEALRQHQVDCIALRDELLPTLPVRLSREREINPFLRSDARAVIDAARARGADATDPVAVFAAIRAWKNEYR